ncbi:hypothetical protein D9758_011413 [Tetrapyrgos nigripes]|uniref:F-box domain-containing protein n=1 Tax=Tetrapyrgos nigripes TaxID=182062 RepID=A0A8H5CSP3_9AGAR|nr:hypothetical protein D9758_011413 [Tetrapyrgos nigripes]
MADSSNPVPLPQEILDDIIGYVKDCDTRAVAIRTCTLVCRDWSHCARRRLFQSFTFPPKSLGFPVLDPEDVACEDSEDMGYLYDVQQHSFKDKLGALMKDLNFWPPDSPLSLGAVVRSLTINGLVWPSVVDSSSAALLAWPQGLFSQVPFTGIKRIHIRRIDYRRSHTIDSPHLSFFKFLDKATSLESLVMEHVHFTSIRGFLELFSHLANATSQLQSLSLVDVRTLEPEELSDAVSCLDSIPPIHTTDIPCLRELKFSDLRYAEVVCAVMSAVLFALPWRFFDLSSLRTLMITHCEPGTWGFCDKIFKHCGSTITALKLDVWDFDLWPDQGLQECLRHLVRAERLEIRLDCAFDSVDSEYPVRAVNTCLAVLPTLEQVTIVFRVLPVFQFEFDGPFPPKSVEEALSALRETTNHHLKEIAYDLKIPTGWKEMNEDDVRECMPLGHSLFL